MSDYENETGPEDQEEDSSDYEDAIDDVLSEALPDDEDG